jgi:hypothetical protein
MKKSNVSFTVHIPDASIEWWYPANYTHPLVIVTRAWGNYSKDNSYAFVPHTTSFDVMSAL